MAIADIRARQENGVVKCGGAHIRAHCRHLATVVTVRGTIDAANTDRVAAHLRRFLLGEKNVVLDFSEVGRFDAAPLLFAFDESSRAAGVEWTLVASPAVIATIGEPDETTLPVSRTVHEALHNLADAIVSRRQLVLPLIGKTA
jgi:anti-anti-sigma regulatory factor